GNRGGQLTFPWFAPSTRPSPPVVQFRGQSGRQGGGVHARVQNTPGRVRRVGGRVGGRRRDGAPVRSRQPARVDAGGSGERFGVRHRGQRPRPARVGLLLGPGLLFWCRT